MLSDEMIKKYLLIDDLSTYDPYDIWKKNLGIKVKQLYYKNKYLGSIPAGLLTMYDLYINNTFRLGYEKQEYPIVRAQACLALLNLYKKNKKGIYLKYAKKHIDWLLENSLKGYSGYCWGLNFNWVYSKDDIYNKNTPFSTHSPYPLEAMVLYYKITKDKTLIKPIKSLFLFLEYDIKVMEETEDMLILSYGTTKDRIVTNANSYMMYMYALLLEFFPEKKEYLENKIYKIYNFLVSVQKSNGSWIYQPYDDNSFIDCFHSIFVVKNIIKTDKILKFKDSEVVRINGYSYIKENFLNIEKGLVKRFSQSNKLSLIRFDLYDNAEMLNLAYLMNDKSLIESLSNTIKNEYQSDDDIYSTIETFGMLKNKNHLRWAVMPYVYSLSNLKEI